MARADRVYRGSPGARGGQWKVKLLELVLVERGSETAEASCCEDRESINLAP